MSKGKTKVPVKKEKKYLVKYVDGTAKWVTEKEAKGHKVLRVEG